MTDHASEERAWLARHLYDERLEALKERLRRLAEEAQPIEREILDLEAERARFVAYGRSTIAA